MGDMRMRCKLIACKVLNREIGELSAVCPNVIDITWLRQGFHNEPDVLRRTLQGIIDRIDAGNDPGTFAGASNGLPGLAPGIDAILLGYGLCSNGLVGITSRRHPLVIPRGHDCITLFLGSRQRYQACFDEMSGRAFWYTPGWIESCPMPCKENRRRQVEAYTKKYGAENGKFLLEMENSWYRDYAFAAYINPENAAYPDYRAFTREAAAYFGWEYREFAGDNRLLRALLSGDWAQEDFLVIPPGKTALPSYDSGIIRLGTPEEADEFWKKQLEPFGKGGSTE